MKKFNPQIAQKAIELVAQACAIRRQQLNIYQKDLANISGLTQRQISDFEAGKQNLTLKSFFSILGSLDMHLELSEKNPDNLEGYNYRGLQ